MTAGAAGEPLYGREHELQVVADLVYYPMVTPLLGTPLAEHMAATAELMGHAL